MASWPIQMAARIPNDNQNGEKRGKNAFWAEERKGQKKMMKINQKRVEVTTIELSKMEDRYMKSTESLRTLEESHSLVSRA